MSTLMELTVVLVVCPALLAAWLDNRYPGSGRGDAPDRDPHRPRRPARLRGASPLLLTVGALLPRPGRPGHVVRGRLHDHHLRHRRVAVGDAQHGRAGPDTPLAAISVPPEPRRPLVGWPRLRRACARPACFRIALTCQRTVSGERYSRSAISAVVAPEAIICRISSCRGVSRLRALAVARRRARRRPRIAEQVRDHLPGDRGLAVEGTADRPCQAVGRLVLGQVAVGAGAHRGQHVRRIARHGQHDQLGAVAVALADPADHVDAAAAIQVEVDHRTVGLVRLESLEPVVQPACGCHDGKARALEERDQPAQKQRMILHDDDARLAHYSVVHPPNRVGNPQDLWRMADRPVTDA